MLWLTGLIGLMAVSTAIYVDVGTSEPEEEPDPPSDAERVNLILGMGAGESINDIQDDTMLAPNADFNNAPEQPVQLNTFSDAQVTEGALHRGSLDFLFGPNDAETGKELIAAETADTSPPEDHGDMIEGTAAASIMDYEPEEDSLLVVWDDSDANSVEPEIVVQADPNNTGQLQVWLGNEVVAQVSGDTDLQAAEVSLIPLSSAISLNLVDA